jgi:hypothetical protein
MQKVLSGSMLVTRTYKSQVRETKPIEHDNGFCFNRLLSAPHMLKVSNISFALWPVL